MHIVIVDTLLTTPPTGGAHTFLVDLCDLLMRRGTRVSVVTEPGTDESLVRAIVQSGAEIQRRVAHRGHGDDRVLVNELGRFSLSFEDHRKGIEALHLTAQRCEIHHQKGQVVSHVETMLVRLADIERSDSILKQRLATLEERLTELEKRLNIPPERTRQVPYGVKSISIEELETGIADSRDQSTPLAIGYVGRIVQEQKRIMDFVPLASELLHRDVSFELHVIGEGSERPRLATALERQGLAVHAKFWGWLESSVVRRRLRELDVFLLMSDYEGLPVALLEAMGHGLVPVVSRIASGNGQLVIDGENGFLINIGDVAAFAQRLKLLADERSLLATMKRAAWKTSQQYTVELMADRYLECFDYIKTTGLSREYRIQVQFRQLRLARHEAADRDDDPGERRAIDRRRAPEPIQEPRPAQLAEHRLRLAPIDRCQPQRHIAQCLDPDTAESDQHHRPEGRIAPCPDDQFQSGRGQRLHEQPGEP